MPRIIYECEKCGINFETEADAKACENEHPAVESLTIEGVSYDAVVIKGSFPDSIYVLSSNESTVIAHYKLSGSWEKSFYE